MSGSDCSGRIQNGEATAGEPLLSRWARRKEQARRGIVEPEPTSPASPAEASSVESLTETVRIDARTGKPYDELTDEDMPPIESLDTNSDLSVFMAKNISPLLRTAAFSKVFRSAHYNQYCLCAEYAEDYTNFTPLGDIVPHELKATIVREAKRLRELMLERGKELSQEEAEARIRAEREAGLPRSSLPDLEPGEGGATLASAELPENAKREA